MELAPYCTDEEVGEWLKAGNTGKLILFIKRRHEARFFKPIEWLRRAPDSCGGYGFSMMALCSLLIETIECYRLGVPTTNGREWKNLLKIQEKETVPCEYHLETKQPANGCQAFASFFRDFQSFFPSIKGAEFYGSIRNGLLHQAQTKAGWTIGTRGHTLCDPVGKHINRNLFANALRAAFDKYTNDLRDKSWADKEWTHAARKVWWLIRISRC